MNTTIDINIQIIHFSYDVCLLQTIMPSMKNYYIKRWLAINKKNYEKNCEKEPKLPLILLWQASLRNEPLVNWLLFIVIATW